jgi:hypothetical protein
MCPGAERGPEDSKEPQIEGAKIMTNRPTMSRNFVLLRGLFGRPLGRATGALALAFCLSATAQARQEQQQGQQDQQGQQQQQQGQEQGQQQEKEKAQEPKAKPVYASQDADKPPYSNHRPQRNVPRGEYPAAQSEQPAQAVQAAQAVPETLTVPAGTILLVRINEFLSSEQNQIGDQFTAELEQPIVVNGWVVARRGQVVTGKVKEAQKAGRVKGVSQLGVELTDLTVVDGRQVAILTELWKGSGGTSHGEDAATVVGGTGLGAAIGAAADWGKGAAIGAGAGAAAGIAAVLLTRGRPTILEPETQLSFRLVDPVRVDTTQGQQAFLPVTQGDYEGGRQWHRGPPRQVAGRYPGWTPYGCGYYSPCYAYPGYVGFYDDFGRGPGYYGGFHGRGGFRH